MVLLIVFVATIIGYNVLSFSTSKQYKNNEIIKNSNTWTQMKPDLLNLSYKIIKMNYSYSFYSISYFFRDTLPFETIFTKEVARMCLQKRRNSYRRCSIRKGVLKNFTNFTENNCVGVSFLQLYYKETPTQVSFLEYCKIFKTTYFEEHLWTTASDRKTEKHPHQNFVFNKIADCFSVNYSQLFLCKFCDTFQKWYFAEQLKAFRCFQGV